MDIRLLDNYELRRVDDRNWQLYKLKELESGKRKGEVDWVPLGIYPQTIEGSIQWIFENAPKADWENAKCDLEGAIGELREIERDMAAHAREFGKAAG